jgi:hypothetical protein
MNFLLVPQSFRLGGQVPAASEVTVLGTNIFRLPFLEFLLAHFLDIFLFVAIVNPSSNRDGIFFP